MYTDTEREGNVPPLPNFIFIFFKSVIVYQELRQDFRFFG